MGIDSDIFVNIHESLKCPVCLDVLEDPAIAQCGHTCCYFCWYSIARGSNESPRKFDCPLCRKDYEAPGMPGFSIFIILTESLINNLIAKQIIDDSLTKCHWPGCRKNIKYSERDRHFSECRLRTIPKVRYIPRLPSVRIGHQVVNLVNLDTRGCQVCERGFETKIQCRQHMMNIHAVNEDDVRL
jgi:hypothetical protein